MTTTRTFCDCPMPAGDPADSGPSFAAGTCLACGRLHEEASLSFLTMDGGANFSLQTSGGIAMTDSVYEFLRATKARLVEWMLARLAELRAARGREHA